MSASGKLVLIEDPYNQPEIGTAMEFHLTYAGPLFAIQRDDRPGQKPRHPENKHQIRTTFHKQLKELWRVTPGLASASGRRRVMVMDGNSQPPLTDIGPLAQRYALYGFNFVPLVTQELDLICGLEILFLRPDRPGQINIWAGDIDNRLKTLLDALRIPEPSEDYAKRTPSADEKPFFCLLEDDKLITKVSVETDRLLEPVKATIDPHDARLVITVRLRPYEVHVDNLHFG